MLFLLFFPIVRFTQSNYIVRPDSVIELELGHLATGLSGPFTDYCTVQKQTPNGVVLSSVLRCYTT